MIEQLFSQLYEASRLLALPSSRDQRRVVECSSLKIEQDTKKLAEKTAVDQETIAKSHYFLANKGLKTNEILPGFDTIKAKAVRVQSVVLADTDIQEYLQESVDTIICNSIESNQEHTIAQSEAHRKRFLDQMRKKAQKKNRLAKERNEVISPKVSGEPIEGALELHRTENTLKKRIFSYAHGVKSINDCRLRDKDCSVVSTFMKTAEQEWKDSKVTDTKATDVWDLLSWLTGEENASDQERLEGTFMKVYVTQSPKSPEAIELTRKLTRMAKKWHEQQVVRLIDDSLLKKAQEAQVGGNPEFGHRLKKYIQLEFRQNNQWKDKTLEIVENIPKWAYTYLLIRSGHPDIALEYMTEQAEKYPEDNAFLKYFKEYMENPNHLLSNDSRKEITDHYRRLQYDGKTKDPYKLLLFKLIGRCEVHEKSVEGAIISKEDYIWLQLSLIREGLPKNEYNHEQYSLADLQKCVLSFGPSAFDTNNNNPWVYFMVLVSTLQFEQAICYLHQQEATRLDAVHFAIAFAYYGLLRIPIQKSASDDLLIIGPDSIPRINFERLMYHYVSVYVSESSTYALQYLLMLSLYSVHHGFPNDSLLKLSQTYVCELVGSTKEFKTFLGEASVRDGRKPGLVDTYKTLLGATNEADIVNKILLPVAKRCSEAGLYRDAVKVQELALDYNGAVDVLIQQLASSIRRPIQHPPTLHPQDQKWIDELDTFTCQLIDSYKKNVNVKDAISTSKLSTIDTLIQLLRFRVIYEQGHYEQALQHMYQVGVIPLNDINDNVYQTLSRLKAGDRVLIQCVPSLLTIVVNLLRELRDYYSMTEDENNDARKEINDSYERYAHSVFKFVGNLNIILPAEASSGINSAIARILIGMPEVCRNQDRGFVL
ncbi:Nup93/Nic96-domain-containing protein [Phycomyces nitens]|nr:Nup93/Nic96-domain-containing protein [Phycomyces nitens]